MGRSAPGSFWWRRGPGGRSRRWRRRCSPRAPSTAVAFATFWRAPEGRGWRRVLADADDATLVLAARRGDGAAFAALYVRHQRRLLRLCGRLVGDSFQAEEVAQEAAVEALIGLPRLVAPE